MSEAVIAAVASVLSASIAGISAYKAARAERNSRPVSNGFAGEVTSGISHLNERLITINKDIRDLRNRLIDHIDGHE